MANNTKYLIGLIGLVAGFLISFLWVSNYNKSNTPAGTAAGGMMTGGPAGQPGAQGQQAMMGQVQQAIEKAKNNPKDFQAQLDAAKVYFQVKRVPETVEFLMRAYELKPEEFKTNEELGGAVAYIAQYQIEQKKYDQAEVWFRRALDITPGDNDVRVELAYSYIERQPPQPDQAIQELQTALKANPKDAHALGHLVEAYAVKKDAAGAQDALNRLLDSDATYQRLPALQGLVADLKAGKPVTLPKEQ